MSNATTLQSAYVSGGGTPCRREETALCNPHQSVLAKLKLQPGTSVPEQLDNGEKQCMAEKKVMSEKEFLWNHSLYSTMSSWLFAIAGATNIGLLSVLSSKALMAAEQGKPMKQVFSNKKYNRIVAGMIAFGGVCMTVSNWLESKKVVTEWQLGAGKLQRKMNIAETRTDGQQAQTAPAAQAAPAAKAAPVAPTPDVQVPADVLSVQAPGADASAPQKPRNWEASLPPRADNFSEKEKNAAPAVAAIG